MILSPTNPITFFPTALTITSLISGSFCTSTSLLISSSLMLSLLRNAVKRPLMESIAHWKKFLIDEKISSLFLKPLSELEESTALSWKKSYYNHLTWNVMLNFEEGRAEGGVT